MHRGHSSRRSRLGRQVLLSTVPPSLVSEVLSTRQVPLSSRGIYSTRPVSTTWVEELLAQYRNGLR